MEPVDERPGKTTSRDAGTAPPVDSHNRLHRVWDVSFDEDRSQVRTGQCPHVMASLRNSAMSLLRLSGWDNTAKAGQCHARNPATTVTWPTEPVKHRLSGPW